MGPSSVKTFTNNNKLMSIPQVFLETLRINKKFSFANNVDNNTRKPPQVSS